MTNAYVTAFEARIVEATRKNASASNIKKLTKMREACSFQSVVALLDAHEIDADRFSRAIYASEKAVNFVQQAIELNANKLNENTYAIFRTAINCYRHDTVMTKEDARASISRDIVVKDDRKHLVFVRNAIQTVETVNAQHQTSIDALLTLKILTVSNAVKNSYDVHMTDLAQQLCDNLKIDTAKVEIEEDENEDA
jgi:hypothetical protein